MKLIKITMLIILSLNVYSLQEIETSDGTVIVIESGTVSTDK